MLRDANWYSKLIENLKNAWTARLISDKFQPKKIVRSKGHYKDKNIRARAIAQLSSHASMMPWIHSSILPTTTKYNKGVRSKG